LILLRKRLPKRHSEKTEKAEFRLSKQLGWGTRIPAQTRIADQKPLACSAFS
jgi:hypothetical protein